MGASDEHGAYVAERPLSPGDIAATVYHHLGLDGRTVAFPDRAGRPLYLVETGEPIRELVGEVWPTVHGLRPPVINRLGERQE